MNINKAIAMQRKYEAATASPEEKEQAVSKAHDYVLLGYTLLQSADIIFRKAEKVMQKVSAYYSRDERYRMERNGRDLDAVLKRLDTVSEGMDGAVAGIDPSAYDRIRSNAYEVLRFVMLLYTRTSGNVKATEALEKSIRRMAGNGMFSDEEISEIKMR